jgi:hypothetical protein
MINRVANQMLATNQKLHKLVVKTKVVKVVTRVKIKTRAMINHARVMVATADIVATVNTGKLLV